MHRLRIIATDQPGWVWRGAIRAFAFIILLPILLLVALALLAGVIVFGVLAGLSMLMQQVRGTLRRGSDGRENVRVIMPRE